MPFLVSFCKDRVHIWVAQNLKVTKEELGRAVPCLSKHYSVISDATFLNFRNKYP